MSCKYYRHRILNVPVIGQAEPIHIQEELCLLKFQSIQKKVEVYQVLFEKGLQGGMFSDDCPFGRDKKWKECPFYESET